MDSSTLVGSNVSFSEDHCLSSPYNTNKPQHHLGVTIDISASTRISFGRHLRSISIDAWIMNQLEGLSHGVLRGPIASRCNLNHRTGSRYPPKCQRTQYRAVRRDLETALVCSVVTGSLSPFTFNVRLTTCRQPSFNLLPEHNMRIMLYQP